MPRSGRYRGRRRIARLLGFIGILLIIVSALSVTAYLFLRDYITRTDDGLLVSLPFLDWFSGSSPSPTPYAPDDDDNGDMDIIFEPSATPEPTPSAPPEDIPVHAPVTVSPAFLAQRDISNSAKLDELAALYEAGDINTVIVEVKAISGVIIASDTFASAAEKFGDGLQLVAYFSALEDNSITRQREAFGIKHTSGVNWLDANKSRWINPYIPENREWLAAQLSAVDPGIFHAVLVDKLWFPPDGRIEQMLLPDEPPREEILETLRAELVGSTTLPCWMVDAVEGRIVFEGDVYADFPAGAFD